MKKAVTFLFAFVMVLSLVACGGNSGGNNSEKHGYYKDYEWGLSQDAVSEKLKKDGLEFAENIGLLDISKYNIQKPVFTNSYDGGFSIYNIKYLDKYNLYFGNFKFDKGKELVEVSFQLDGYYSVEDYESIKAELIKKLGENNNKDDEWGLVLNTHTATWETDVSHVTLFFHEGTPGKGMISITYDELEFYNNSRE